MRVLRHADQHQGAVALEQRRERIQVVAGGNGVEDEIETVRMRLHLRVVARDHHLVGPQRQCVLALALGRGEGHHVRAHGMGELDAHVAKPADADDADLLARADVPVAQG